MRHSRRRVRSAAGVQGARHSIQETRNVKRPRSADGDRPSPARQSPATILHRRCRLGSSLALLLTGLALLATPATAAAPRPNIVILLADDLGWADVGYHGGEIETPSIDRLAREGVRLDRFYSAPICSPTRAALVTGRDPIELGIAYDQIHPWYNVGLAARQRTIADVFRDAGYQTALVGKWHLGHTFEHQTPNARGFEHFWGHLHTNTDFYTHEREGGHDLQRNGQSVFAEGEYLTHLEAGEAVRFIRERDHERPFLLYVPFTAPHSPMQAPEETIEKYASLPLEKNRRIYAAMVDEMDRGIGRILDALDEEELARDTIVLFFSDNGGSSIYGGVNTPLKGEKGQTFEGGIRVPAVVRWPDRLEAGGEMAQMTTVMDVLPTLAAAAEVELGETDELDGQDMWPALARGEERPRRQPVGFASEIPIPGLIHLAIFDGRWKLVQVLREGQSEIRTRNFLYDIESDPNEEHDLATAHPEELERLLGMLHDWRKRHPLAGTRGTLVAHPGWVAPRSWAEAVLPAKLLQSEWKNELPFSQALIDATSERGVLVDEATRRELLEAEAKRNEKIRRDREER
jgi:arylsulfatase A-like enzyme